ncbi:unnamed protein product [Schistosoma intercalatum]|nr:unnamed protein product [Schistosoma intercalatum]
MLQNQFCNDCFLQKVSETFLVNQREFGILVNKQFNGSQGICVKAWMLFILKCHLLMSLSKFTTQGYLSPVDLRFFRSLSCLPHLATTSGHPANSVITVMVLGIPNSGKSTLINVLRSIGQGGPGGAARVGRTAGQTRSVGHPIILYRGNSSHISDDIDDSVMGLTDYKIQVFDTPGILEPRARTLSERLSLCVCGAVDYSSLQPEVLVDYLLFWLNRRQRTEYVSLFDLPGPTTDVNELLISVCFKNKFFLTVSKPSWLPNEIETSDELFKSNITQKMAIPDIKRAAFHILSLFNKRYFGPVTFLPEDEKLADNFFHLA